jgi:hypothetical protein
MTLFRMITVLVGGLLLLLMVVILRAETTHLHYVSAGYQHSAEELHQQLRDAELELARLRNPMRIREQVQQAASHFAEEPPAPAPSAPARRRSGGTR